MVNIDKKIKIYCIKISLIEKHLFRFSINIKSTFFKEKKTDLFKRFISFDKIKIK